MKDNSIENERERRTTGEEPTLSTDPYSDGSIMEGVLHAHVRKERERESVFSLGNQNNRDPEQERIFLCIEKLLRLQSD